ncbi:MAG: hypothetical protein IJ669_04480 [Prevotella sp.]|nr:hypothetical protein [Prevotella sp.]
MDEIQEFRTAVLKILLEAKDKKGEPRFTESDAKRLLAELRDDEIKDGLPFNTPEDVAEVLLEV